MSDISNMQLAIFFILIIGIFIWMLFYPVVKGIIIDNKIDSLEDEIADLKRNTFNADLSLWWIQTNDTVFFEVAQKPYTFITTQDGFRHIQSVHFGLDSIQFDYEKNAGETGFMVAYNVPDTCYQDYNTISCDQFIELMKEKGWYEVPEMQQQSTEV